MARQRDAEKQVQILDAAFEVFGAAGYQATKISHIAERAGIAQGTVYTYFKDKEELFRASVEEGWNRFLSQIRELARSSRPSEERMSDVVDIGFQTLKEALPLLRGMLFESSQMQLFQGKLGELCALIEEMLAQGAGPAQRAAKHAGALVARQRRSVVRVVVVGVLFSAALCETGRIDAEIAELKRTVVGLLETRGSSRGR